MPSWLLRQAILPLTIVVGLSSFLPGMAQAEAVGTETAATEVAVEPSEPAAETSTEPTETTDPSDEEVAGPTIEEATKDFTNIVPQTTEYTCGPAALATLILQKGGATTDEMQIADASGTTEDSGTSMLGLKKAADALGYVARVKRWDLSTLEHATLPVLVNDKAPDGSAHYSVVTAFTDTGIKLADTKLGNIEFDLDDFAKSYTGMALTISPKQTVTDGMSIDAVANIIDANPDLGAVVFDQNGNVIPADQLDDAYDDEAASVTGKGGVDSVLMNIADLPWLVRTALAGIGVTSVTAVIAASGEVTAIIGGGIIIGALGTIFVKTLITSIESIIATLTAEDTTIMLAKATGVSTAVAGAALGSSTAECLSSQWHHIATDKNATWTPLFKEMFDKAGMDISTDPLNLIDLVGHCGRHKTEYHEEILKRLKKAVEGLSENKYTKALKNALKEIGKDLVTKGSSLNKLIVK